MMRKYCFIFPFLCIAILFAKDDKKHIPGYLALLRFEDNGVINIRECFIKIDSIEQEVALIGGDEKRVALSVGQHILFAHSKNPYDLHSDTYTWRSDSITITISIYKTTTVLISPKSNSKGYCCGWKIDTLVPPNHFKKK